MIEPFNVILTISLSIMVICQIGTFMIVWGMAINVAMIRNEIEKHSLLKPDKSIKIPVPKLQLRQTPGRAIKEARTSKGLTQKQVVESIRGMHASCFSKFERDLVPVPNKYKARLAKFLEIDKGLL